MLFALILKAPETKTISYPNYKAIAMIKGKYDLNERESFSAKNLFIKKVRIETITAMKSDGRLYVAKKSVK